MSTRRFEFQSPSDGLGMRERTDLLARRDDSEGFLAMAQLFFMINVQYSFLLEQGYITPNLYNLEKMFNSFFLTVLMSYSSTFVCFRTFVCFSQGFSSVLFYFSFVVL